MPLMDKSNNPFVLPRTLDEWMVIGAFIAWPLIFIFLLQPKNVSPAASVIAWVVAFVIQCGIFVGLQTARRQGR